MKKIWVLMVCFPALLCAQEGRIRLSVKNGGGQAVRIIPPLHGQFFWGTIRTELADSNGTIVLQNKETVPGAYTFYCDGSYSLYVRPGQDYQISIDKANQQAPLTIEAADAVGQLRLNELTNQFYQSAGQAYYAADTSFLRNKAKARAALDSCIRLFRGLHDAAKIDSSFFAYATKKAGNYYAAVLGASLIQPTLKLQFNKDSARYNTDSIRLLRSQWQELNQLSDVFDPASSGSGEYIDYSNLYNMWCLGYIQGNLNGTFRVFESEDQYEQFHYNNIQQYYTEPLREYLSASHLGYLLLDNKFQPFITDEYESFAQQYPESVYTGSMQAGIQKIQAYQEKSKAAFSARQLFVAQADSIRTFDVLASQFKGQTVFVDLWATWCSPCKDEFAYNKELYAFLETKGIKSLYISIDRDKDEARWKDMIKYYDLQGYHIRAFPALMQDIRDRFGKDQTLTIPRYILLKDGKVVEAFARAPSEKEALYQQLGQYL